MPWGSAPAVTRDGPCVLVRPNISQILWDEASGGPYKETNRACNPNQPKGDNNERPLQQQRQRQPQQLRPHQRPQRQRPHHDRGGLRQPQLPHHRQRPRCQALERRVRRRRSGCRLPRHRRRVVLRLASKDEHRPSRQACRDHGCRQAGVRCREEGGGREEGRG